MATLARIPAGRDVFVEGDKVNRAHAISPQIEAGNVYLPGAPNAAGTNYDRTRTPRWVQDLVDEAAAFPNAAHDDQVDALHDSLFRILLTHMLEDATTISAALELFLVSRNLERVADLATNIAEDAVYLAEGKTIKHRLEDRTVAATA